MRVIMFRVRIRNYFRTRQHNRIVVSAFSHAHQCSHVLIVSVAGAGLVTLLTGVSVELPIILFMNRFAMNCMRGKNRVSNKGTCFACF